MQRMRATLKKSAVYIILLLIFILSACNNSSNDNSSMDSSKEDELIVNKENKHEENNVETSDDEEDRKQSVEQNKTNGSENNQVSKNNESKEEDKQDKKIEKKEEAKTNLVVTDLYLPLSNSEERKGEITHIVIHFSSDVANNPENPYNINNIYNIFKNNKVSTHYTIDREGKIYRMVDENRSAWHAGKGSLPDYPHYKNNLNQYSVGIELLAIGTKEELHKLVPHVDYESIDPVHIGYTDAQYDSLKLLIHDIVSRNPSIKMDRKHIIGHDEYTDRRTDPGKLFDWSKIGF